MLPGTVERSVPEALLGGRGAGPALRRDDRWHRAVHVQAAVQARLPLGRVEEEVSQERIVCAACLRAFCLCSTSKLNQSHVASKLVKTVHIYSD